ncbi:hypothetical protein LUZ60_012570 [Juncus effusus]|nr:hypothetical protein LUZ60_012570 [Juncus effusus]
MADRVDDTSAEKIAEEKITEEKIAEETETEAEVDGAAAVSEPAMVERSQPPADESTEVRRRRLFGREKPVHAVLGGGKTADVLLWREKKSAIGALTIATAIWVLFELLNYHLLSLLSNSLLFSLAGFFIWSKLMSYINRAPVKIPELYISEEKARRVAIALRNDINRVTKLFRDVALGHEFKKFFMVVAGLWVLSVVGSWFDFLTLFYIGFVMLHTVPVLYEKYEDKVDEFGERGLSEVNKVYRVVDEKVLSKIPRGPMKAKKSQ